MVLGVAATLVLLLPVGSGAQAETKSDPSLSRMTGSSSDTLKTKSVSALPNANTKKMKTLKPRGSSSRQSASTKKTEDTNQKRRGAGTQSTTMPPASGSVHTPTVKPPTVAPSLPPTLPVITYFNQDAQKWLRAGETVYVTMQGTPGAQASFHIGNLSGNVALREESPGQYLGAWVVPVNKPLPTTPYIVLGELRVNGKTAEPMPASRPIMIDALPPTIANTSPQTAATATPAIGADLSDEGSGINIASIHLRLNGRDVTSSAEVRADHISFTPMSPLAAGEHTVELETRDRAGNKTTQIWRFLVKL